VTRAAAFSDARGPCSPANLWKEIPNTARTATAHTSSGSISFRTTLLLETSFLPLSYTKGVWGARGGRGCAIACN
jgi:hypothetical protein